MIWLTLKKSEIRRGIPPYGGKPAVVAELRGFNPQPAVTGWVAMRMVPPISPTTAIPSRLARART